MIPMVSVLAAPRIVTPEGVLAPGWIRVAGDRIDAVGAGAPAPDDAVHRLDGAWVVPGFVDVHVHGGAGGSYTTAHAEDARRAAAFHRTRGTTSTVASVVTAPLEEMAAAVATLAGLVAEGILDGVHLEGPWLNPARRGAQSERDMRAPDPAELERLLAAGDGAVRMVTIAPELPGGLDLVRRAAAAGLVVAVGHSDATAAQAEEAFAAGATHVTHLFNALRPLHHREPGVAGAALAHPTVTCELICDGIHVHDGAVRLAARAAGAHRLLAITDATAAAGMGDGTYRLGPMTVVVRGGVAELEDGSSLAGSVLTMDRAFARLVRDVGLEVEEAAAMTAGTPARVLGLRDVGVIASGCRADLAVLDEDLGLRAVMAAGAWVSP
ncbi:MAG: N-acetylglucosamine-6-phosphate deacetylase [Solirubrobacteraceae bacterium]|jgi:N-acetylglucosamine-6-phosphate deacetylase|nr:N-acetylglucosamine-6-phosphate deacetylase [Solirubrobacteraceae bacterium]